MKTKIFLILFFFIFAIILGLTLGSTSISLNTIFSDTISKTVILNIRLPRILVAIVIGACLSVGGLCIQSMLKNPLASPFTLGVSSGAGLAATIAIVLNLTIFGSLTIQIFSFFGALLTIYIVIKFSSKIDANLSTETIVLSGMILSLFLNAFISLIMIINVEETRRIIMFTTGSLALRSWDDLLLSLPLFIGTTIYIYIRSKQLDILTFGEDDAHSLGVNVKKLKIEIMILTSILTATAVATCGIIGFVGLVVPHITRKIVGPNHFISIPMAALIGGAFLIISDLLSRSLFPPIELPVGAITALIGAPFFAIVFFARRYK